MFDSFGKCDKSKKTKVQTVRISTSYGVNNNIVRF